MADETLIRGGAFLAALVLLLLAERLRGLRAARAGRWRRRADNLGLLVFNTLLLRALWPAALFGVALAAERRGVGLFNMLQVPGWLATAVSVIALDCAIYWQHRWMHAFTPLWRLHRVHHTDPDLDATTGLRFHPLEILLSAAYKAPVVLLLGVPPLAVIVFEVLLNVCSMFNHGNIGIGPRLDRWLRFGLVTPRMHWVHHSVVPAESRRNFGFCLPWWDRLFGSYATAPAAGFERFEAGVRGFGDAESSRLGTLLWQPFAGDREGRSSYTRPAAGPF